jgi:site-specific recombinase XerD
MIEGYLARHRDDPDKPVSKATRNRHLACLKTLFKAAVDWNFASTNPAERVKMEKEQQRVPDALSEEEVARLFEHLAEHLRPVVVFAVDCLLQNLCVVEHVFGEWGVRWSPLQDALS